MNADLLQGFYLGDLLVEPARGRVTGPDVSEHLPSKAVEVLLCLAEHPGEVVTRDSLLEDVWGVAGGSNEALSHAVSEIRHALGDHREDPSFIQTLPKRGYRLLISPVFASGDTASVVLGTKNSVSPEDLGLFENLKRRGVLETALAYLILGWLLIQIADIVFDQLLLPQWAGTFVTVLVIAGFPIALVLSWFLEFRDGRAVVHELSPKDARRRRFSRTYMSVIGALAIAAIVVFIYDSSIGLPEEVDPAARTVDPGPLLLPVHDNSIAVLPLFNIDGSDETQIFADGLADDVITRLSRVPGLRVSSRGDSFSLQPNSTSQKVRERLRVASYLEGSVETRGNEIRVIVQFIDSETGFHILSRTFDRPRDEFFDIRDEITALTVANVRVALPAATQAMSRVTASEPSLDAYVLYRRGVDAARLPKSIDNINLSLGWYERALDVDPDYAAAHAGICEIYVYGYIETDDPVFIDQAESSCAVALELNPNLVVVHTALGRLYTSTGQYDDAEAAFQRALQINPTSAASFLGLGDVYFRQNRLDEAESNLQLAVGLHPGDWSAYNRLGNFMYRTGRYTEAAENYRYVVSLDRSNMNGFSNLGTAYMLAGNFTAATQAFEEALQIEPKKITYSNLGLMYYYLGQLDRSIATHRLAIELEPGDHLAWSNLGDALSVAGRTDDAHDAFATARDRALEALNVNQNDPFYTMDLAWIEAMLGNAEEARELMSRVLDLIPDDPYTHYYDALVFLRAGESDAALGALQMASDKGYPRRLLEAEPLLEPLRTNPKFSEIVNAN